MLKKLVTKTIRCGEVYDKYALSDLFVEGLNALVRQSMREYRGGRKEANFHGVAFHATSLLLLQGDDVTSKRANLSTAKQQEQRRKPWSSYISGVDDVQKESAFSHPASTRKTSGLPVMALSKTSQSAPSDAILLLITSLDALSTLKNAAHNKVCLSESHEILQCSFIQRKSAKSADIFATLTLYSGRHVWTEQTADQVEKDFELDTALVEAIPPGKLGSLR